MLNYLLICVILVIARLELSEAGGNVKRIRGIPLSKNSLYDETKDFECLDGSRKIAFDHVNDDYCDCADGSDEPGTAACPEGKFYCQNAGHQPSYIPSGWVNDGVCDCCDASDEYAAKTHCVNNCEELGREAKVEAQKATEMAQEGKKIKLQMEEHGQQLVADNMLQLKKHQADYLEADRLKTEKEAIKNEIEEKERAALEKYKPAPEPERAPEAPEADMERSQAEMFFKALDTDESASLTLVEIQTRQEFDRDGNKVITEEEAMYFLGGQDDISFDEFVEKAWPVMKPFLMKKEGLFTGPQGTDEDVVDSETEEDEEYAEEEGHDEEPEHEEAREEPAAELPVEPEIQYDSETQRLVDMANEARAQFSEAEKAALSLQNEMRSLETKLEQDYGPKSVFASLDGQCFKFADTDYEYSMCMYGRATQSAKSGGSEVNLGHWKEWTGPASNKYSKMRFDRGLACWNGPSRSVDVELRCGTENQLVWVSEPNRCEYAMAFDTPALCDPDVTQELDHDEL